MSDRFTALSRYRMPAIRAAIGVGVLLVLGLIGMAALIATRDYRAIEAGLLARYQQAGGVTVRFAQRREMLWPKPRIIYEDVEVRRNAGDGAVRARQAVIQFDLMDLLDGSIDGPTVTLVNPNIRADFGPLEASLRSPRTVAALLDQTIGLFDASAGLERVRLVIEDGIVLFPKGGRQGDDIALEAVNGRLRYRAGPGRLDLEAMAKGFGETFSLAASLPVRQALGQTRQAAASLQLAGFGSRLTFAGSMRRDPDLAMIGRVEAQVSESFETRLSGRILAKPNPAGTQPVSVIAANLALDPRGIALESLRITRDGRQLTGIAALRETNQRWALSATMAGDLVDGTATHAALQRLTGPDGGWSREPLAINPFPLMDLDIRLSTREFKLGRVILGNVALSVLTRPGRAELAIVDSRFGEGMVKARVSLLDTPDRQQDLRVQASAERIDIGQFMDRAFGFTRLSGEGTFVVQAEARGGSIATLIGGLNGSAAIDVKNGDVTGIDLARLLTRAQDARQDAALLFALAGKTSFESLRANFALRDGRIEPVGSSFVSPRVNGMLEGVTDLGQQRHQMIIVLRRRVEEANLPAEFYAFRVDGPLLAPTLRPDLRLLQNRS